MASSFSLRGLVPRSVPSFSIARFFSSSTAAQARAAPGGGSNKQAGGTKKNRQAPKSEAYERVKLLKRNMFSPAPPPLRMARQRHLRHWTIHRAWQLFRRQQREAIHAERQRMHLGMYRACEELRKTFTPGRGEGYLYRVAMEKKGVYGLGDIPIEYARMQTEYPPKEPWNHGWKRAHVPHVVYKKLPDDNRLIL
ncbi:hypothetical protein B0I35DRAFT_411994 [Stachybotrys elegans]|uniref:Uncharacterized protein n=1 Tax=Stachybotrys elegans TaxID=80388 RepID=A0A8K0SKQ0_9HYPO|nr:hypothetical protein B0I35DRAFT_411994 [Stachybotrys elegans]